MFLSLTYATMNHVIIDGDKHPEVQYSIDCLSSFKFFIQAYALAHKKYTQIAICQLFIKNDA